MDTSMPKETWIIAGLLSAVLIGGVAFYNVRKAGKETATVNAELSVAQTGLTEASNRLAVIETELTRTRDRLNLLEKEKADAQKAGKDLEESMRAQLQSKDVTISELQGKLTVNILDRVLFDSGEAILKPEGEKVLLQVAEILRQYPNRQIHVAGHTDNVPIRNPLPGRITTNWELSTARATAAVRFLQDKAGVSPSRLGAVGYGEFRPVADNATAEGRAKNRRIAVVVLADELAPTDKPAPPVVDPGAPPVPAPVPAPAAAETTPAPEPAKAE